MKELRQMIMDKLVEDKKIVLKNICTLTVKPARKGKINSPFGTVSRRKSRVGVRFSRKFLEDLDKQL